MKGLKTKAMVETALLSAIAVICIAMWWYLPVLGGFGNMLWPVVPVVLGKKHGMRYATLSVVVVGLIGSMIFGPLTAFIEVLSFGTLGLLIALSYIKNWNYLARYFVPALGFVAGFLLQLVVANYTLGGDIVASLQTELLAAQEAVRESYGAMGYTEEQIQGVIDMSNHLLKQMIMMFPAIAYLAGALLSFIVSSFANMVLRRQRIDVGGLKPFREWQMPMWIAYVFGFSLFGYYWGTTRNIEVLTTISMNGMYITRLLAWVQGLSLVVYFGYRKKFGKGLLIALGVVGLFPPLEFGMVLIGLVDMVTRYKASFMKRDSV